MCSIASENTHLLRKGKYHFTADLLFDRLGFGQTSKYVYSFNSTKQLNPNSQTGDKPYSDISPYKVSECSLTYVIHQLLVHYVHTVSLKRTNLCNLQNRPKFSNRFPMLCWRVHTLYIPSLWFDCGKFPFQATFKTLITFDCQKKKRLKL